MEQSEMLQFLQQVAQQKVSPEEALVKLKNTGFTELEYAKIDTERTVRTGYPEVIYGAGKTAAQIVGIVQAMKQQKQPILATRVTAKKAAAVLAQEPQLQYDQIAQTLRLPAAQIEQNGEIAVVTAGTSDINVAEEAAVTAEFFGNRVTRIYDVGVAGIQRLFSKLDLIRRANVVIVIAGMEGALTSVVGGLVDVPVIAVPTSVGYGSHLNGLTPLLSMLNSCAAGISVVNIDNGFGAAYNASMINHLAQGGKDE
ncbi:nickel pincer cofactor biosynthesis protein LarB [Liquorilactobacillus satsumensis]|uniref:Phosphoribosylaminoimidazole carboxylase catalytic subunit n=1 Tax=Liquorilactobacillus satsumensis DSM 16230 = JCM 12392 TaxID=1423801 RepID=A0A0R1UZH0_9LACO|nr:nickel pincer cofactor biosynthesis protein LarB [Liquorilactobacillus satsumensis]KRL96810.1 phosphoribosylaminoimidazole carboxylase catalytic subunit [Liquorilactobacillus satsumensis DSM 16230 = JCM 12392]MCP9312972.1 nickel pincer cofactor biosynthesis protein LarB [Liquorilactobacillus satsumensis]MCP9328918.1 nickel pincer cofactor biosynthesis protein LarB [Liquorilactobacillus satsumensis]MCP9360127.1 nickel pincer cofactor biosynthesis protein LarB [Liquorilactobacillus satsumensis